MASHPDPGILADFREGLLGRRHSARIRAHLGNCSSCASLDKDLAQVTELLASAPPPRMPDDLVARLENALAAEAATRAANPDLTSRPSAAASQDTGTADPGPGVPDGAGQPRRGQRQRGRTGGRPWQLRPATLRAAAAIAAVLAVGGYVLANLHTGNDAVSSSLGSAPAHGSAATAAPNERGIANGGIAAPAAGLQVIESGTGYLPGRLASQAQAVLASHPVNAAAPHGTSTGTSGTSVGAPGISGQLQSCVRLVTGGLQPLLVDEARYQGQPATIIVLPATAGRAGQVWVTGPSCSATNRDLITHTQLSAG
ncbi:MAG TPA: hypothetical protein VGI74_07680 [Streptosporangiaceae bacterium]